jgi:integrase
MLHAPAVPTFSVVAVVAVPGLHVHSMASIKPVPGGFEVRWELFAQDGRRKRKFKKLLGYTRKQAEAWAAKQQIGQQTIRDRVENGEVITPEIAVGELLDQWLESRKHKAPSTLRRYRIVVAKYLKPAFGAVPVRNLTVATLMAQYRKWESTLSPASVHDHHETLRAALRWGKRNDLVGSVVTEKISSHDMPTIQEYTPHSLTPEEVTVLLAARGAPGRLTSEPWFRVALLAAIHTGCRRGELLALRYSDIAKGCLAVTRSVDEGTREYKSPKNGKSRTIPVSPVLRDALDSLKAHQDANEVPNIQGLIFRRPDGSPVSPAAFSTAVSTLMGSVLGHGTAHDLRDTFASTLYAATKDLLLVSKLLGHSSPTITAKRYATIFQDNAAEAITQAFGQPTDSAA